MGEDTHTQTRYVSFEPKPKNVGIEKQQITNEDGAKS